jgi:hypothetical protein
MSDYIDLDALWRVLLVGLFAGVGIVGLFAVGVSLLTSGDEDDAPSRGGAVTRVGTADRAAAGLCFAVFAVAVVFGLYVMLDK